MKYIIKDNDGNTLIESDYLSHIVFHAELFSTDEKDRSNEELIKISKHLTRAYLKSYVAITFRAFVDAVEEFTTEHILELPVHVIIDLALDREY